MVSGRVTGAPAPRTIIWPATSGTACWICAGGRRRCVRLSRTGSGSSSRDTWRATTWRSPKPIANALPAWARDAEWIRPIDEIDLWTYIGDVTLLASGRNLVQLMGRAEAPGPDGPVAPSPMEALGGPSGASNGWAVGGDVTASGAGMVLANPHFPWYGEARFWECHLRIPGTYDVYGVSLLGAPGIQMGFNRTLGWSHTFSRGHRFTVASLELDGADPTRYRHGDEIRDMRPITHAVEVLGDDGATRSVERTLWRTHHGPMINLPLVGWGLQTGYTYRDANIDNTVVLEQFLRMGMAADVQEMRTVYHEVKGMPWVNTMAADSHGDAWYTDSSATPRLSAAAQSRFTARLEEDLVAAILYENRIAMLDGSDPDDDWLDHRDARSPGLEPPAELPELSTRGVVLNANDSHWLSATDEQLEGYSVMAGLERTPRTLRTRKNLLVATALASRGGCTTDDLLAAVFENSSLSAELLVDDVVERCRKATSVEGEILEVEGHRWSPQHVAEVLGSWDRRFDLTSRGAALWREFMSGFPESAWLDAGQLWAEGFDPSDPVGSPRGLATADAGGDDPVLHALGHAVRVLDSAGIALDAPLGDVQWADRGPDRVAVHGGGEGEGMLNVLASNGALPPSSMDPMPPTPVKVPGRERTGLCEGGYAVTYGTSFLMAVELNPGGPRGVGLLAYGQSSNAESPRHRDGTEAYAAKTVRPLRFTDEQIVDDPTLVRLILRD